MNYVLLQEDALLKWILIAYWLEGRGQSECPWLFLIFLLAPDLTAIGYVFNKRIGSTVYNVGLTYVLPSLVTILYLLLK